MIESGHLTPTIDPYDDPIPFLRDVRIAASESGFSAFGPGAKEDNGSYMDAGVLLSPNVSTLLSAEKGTYRWVSASESGLRGRASYPTLQAVAVPADWSQSSSMPIQVLYDNHRFEVRDEPALGSAALSEPPSSVERFVPGDRTGARYVLSASRRALFMIGGVRPNGTASAQIWRYDLDSHVWSDLTLEATAPATELLRPTRALAATFDDIHDRLIIVDTEGTGAESPRLWTFEFGTGRGWVLADLKTEAFVDMSLAPGRPGEFYLLKTNSPSDGTWQVCRLEVAGDGSPSLTFTGHLSGRGTVVAPPYPATSGTRMHVLQDGDETIINLKAAEFAAEVSPCTG